MFSNYFNGIFGNKVEPIKQTGETPGYDDSEDDKSEGNRTKLDLEGLDVLDKTDFDKRMIGRKSRGDEARWYIIYPDDKFRNRWDFVITM